MADAPHRELCGFQRARGGVDQKAIWNILRIYEISVKIMHFIASLNDDSMRDACVC